jgi:protein N-terminal methyltransferase
MNNNSSNIKAQVPEEGGTDTQGGKYQSIQELWVAELGKQAEQECGDRPQTWYPKAVDYWNAIPATIDGMMGGLTEISKRDLRTSHDFLRYFLEGRCPGRSPTNNQRALDCGAGIGRVTTNLLLPLFETVDLVEQCSKFVEEAKRTIKHARMGQFYESGLQDFVFTTTYDVVWVQWVIGHLHDTDLVAFVRKCKQALAPNGLLCIKDNTCESGFVMDKEDSSVTRSDQHFRALFAQAGLEVVKVLLQPNFPKKLFPVRIYALS